MPLAVGQSRRCQLSTDVKVLAWFRLSRVGTWNEQRICWCFSIRTSLFSRHQQLTHFHIFSTRHKMCPPSFGFSVLSSRQNGYCIFVFKCIFLLYSISYNRLLIYTMISVIHKVTKDTQREMEENFKENRQLIISEELVVCHRRNVNHSSLYL